MLYLLRRSIYAGKIWLIAKSSHFLLSSGVPRSSNKSLVVKQTVEMLLIKFDDLFFVNPLIIIDLQKVVYVFV